MELSSLVRKLGSGSPLPPGAPGPAAERLRGRPDPSAGPCAGGRATRASPAAHVRRCGGFTCGAGPSAVCGGRATGLAWPGLAWPGLAGTEVGRERGRAGTAAASFVGGARGARLPLPGLHFPAAAPGASGRFSAACCSPLPAAGVGGGRGTAAHGGASLGGAEGFGGPFGSTGLGRRLSG